MAYLEELLPEFRKGAKIRCKGWKAGEYIYIDKKGSVMTEKGNVYILDHVDFDSEYWELYQEPIDWDYIIKNKCLCWFSDEDIEEPNFADRLLAIVENESGIKFMTKGKVVFACCRPVSRDEVTFYEERKDE